MDCHQNPKGCSNSHGALLHDFQIWSQVLVDAQRRFLIRFESHLLPVWTFRRDDRVRYSPHKSGHPFHWRVEMMRTMVLEPACVDLIEPLSQARLVTFTTFSFVSTNTGAVISLSDGLHVSSRVVIPFFLMHSQTLFPMLARQLTGAFCQKERNMDNSSTVSNMYKHLVWALSNHQNTTPDPKSRSSRRLMF